MVFVKFKTLESVLSTLTLTNMEKSHGKIVGLVPKYVKSVQVGITWTRTRNVRLYLKIVLKLTRKVTVQNASQDVTIKEISVCDSYLSKSDQKVWCYYYFKCINNFFNLVF